MNHDDQHPHANEQEKQVPATTETLESTSTAETNPPPLNTLAQPPVEPPSKRPFFSSTFLKGTLVGIALALVFEGGYWVSYLKDKEPTITYIQPSKTNKDNSLSTNISKIVKEKGDAVVSITTTSIEKSSAFRFEDPLYNEYYGNLPQTDSTTNALGSGFIISKDGYILTNQHVINNATSIKVKINGIEQDVDAKLVGQDKELDLAVIKVNVKGDLPTLSLADSDKIEVGEWAIAIGNPYGLDHTVTFGVISAKDRSLSVENTSLTNLIQTDTPINPGNSGGPLLNENGDVIGINTAINAEAQNIGFSISINTVKNVLNDLIKNGKILRPSLGIQVQDMTKEISDYYELNAESGALVGQVISGSQADKAGLQVGDVIIGMDKKDVASAQSLIDMLSKKKIGDKVSLLIKRNGETKAVTATLGER